MYLLSWSRDLLDSEQLSRQILSFSFFRPLWSCCEVFWSLTVAVTRLFVYRINIRLSIPLVAWRAG